MIVFRDSTESDLTHCKHEYHQVLLKEKKKKRKNRMGESGKIRSRSYSSKISIHVCWKKRAKVENKQQVALN